MGVLNGTLEFLVVRQAGQKWQKRIVKKTYVPLKMKEEVRQKKGPSSCIQQGACCLRSTSTKEMDARASPVANNGVSTLHYDISHDDRTFKSSWHPLHTTSAVLLEGEECGASGGGNPLDDTVLEPRPRRDNKSVRSYSLETCWEKFGSQTGATQPATEKSESQMEQVKKTTPTSTAPRGRSPGP